MVSKSKPLVSVIVPTYNVEPYFERCVDSILGQEYELLEVILVDDGSPDRCDELIDRYAARDGRVIAIHQQNGGYGKAVNAGLAAAQGDYVSIVEPDDWLVPNSYSPLVEIAERTKVDFVKANFFEVIDEPKKSRHMDEWGFKERVVTPKEFLFELMFAPAAIWANLYRRKFLQENNIKLMETPGASYQDIPFHFQINVLAGAAFVTDLPIYYYNLDNPEQSMKKTRNVDDRFKVYEHIQDFVQKTALSNDMSVMEVKWCHEFYMYKRNFRAVESDLKRYSFEKTKGLLKQMEVGGLGYERFSLRQKLDAFCLKSLPFWVYLPFDYMVSWRPVSLKVYRRSQGARRLLFLPVCAVFAGLELLFLPVLVGFKLTRYGVRRLNSSRD